MFSVCVYLQHRGTGFFFFFDHMDIIYYKYICTEGHDIIYNVAVMGVRFWIAVYLLWRFTRLN